MPISADHEVSWAATWVTTTVAGHACTVFGDESQTMLMCIVATAVLAAGTRLFMSAIKHCQDHKQTRFAKNRCTSAVAKTRPRQKPLQRRRLRGAGHSQCRHTWDGSSEVVKAFLSAITCAHTVHTRNVKGRLVIRATKGDTNTVVSVLLATALLTVCVCVCARARVCVPRLDLHYAGMHRHQRHTRSSACDGHVQDACLGIHEHAHACLCIHDHAPAVRSCRQ